MQNALVQDKAGVLVIDMQEKLVPLVERSCAVVEAIRLLLQGAKILHLPLLVSEQYPQGLGPTIAPLLSLFPQGVEALSKSSFSAVADAQIAQAISSSGCTQWILVGIEAHVCVLQTARDLLAQGAEVVVLNDAISSRSIFDYSTAIGEMRDLGARISSVETVLFELLQGSQNPAFKEMSHLIQQGKQSACAGC